MNSVAKMTDVMIGDSLGGIMPEVSNAFIDALAGQLKKKAASGFSFPDGYDISRELTGAYLILQQATDKNHRPMLEVCTKESIAQAMMDMVTLGLSAQRHQGYFIAYGNKCTFQRGYFGNIAMAYRLGMKSVNAQCIFKGDDFSFEIVDGVKNIKHHEQKFENLAMENIVGAYAVVKMNNGDKWAEVMTMDQIDRSWNQSMMYNAGAYKTNEKDTHYKFPDQMAKKTVIGRAVKLLINGSPNSWITEMDAFKNSEELAPEERAEIEINKNANKIMLDIPKSPVTEIPTGIIQEPIAQTMQGAPREAEPIEVPQAQVQPQPAVMEPDF